MWSWPYSNSITNSKYKRICAGQISQSSILPWFVSFTWPIASFFQTNTKRISAIWSNGLKGCWKGKKLAAVLVLFGPAKNSWCQNTLLPKTPLWVITVLGWREALFPWCHQKNRCRFWNSAFRKEISWHSTIWERWFGRAKIERINYPSYGQSGIFYTAPFGKSRLTSSNKTTNLSRFANIYRWTSVLTIFVGWGRTDQQKKHRYEEFAVWLRRSYRNGPRLTQSCRSANSFDSLPTWTGRKSSSFGAIRRKMTWSRTRKFLFVRS